MLSLHLLFKSFIETAIYRRSTYADFQDASQQFTSTIAFMCKSMLEGTDIVTQPHRHKTCPQTKNVTAYVAVITPNCKSENTTIKLKLQRQVQKYGSKTKNTTTKIRKNHKLGNKCCVIIVQSNYISYLLYIKAL